MRKYKKRKEFDRAKKVPIIRASICTGEKVIGFRDLETGKFEELFLATEKELKKFMEEYQIKEEEIKKEW